MGFRVQVEVWQALLHLTANGVRYARVVGVGARP